MSELNLTATATATVTISIDTDTMVDFFSKDPSIGTGSHPYIADDFSTIVAPEGFEPTDIRNAFKLKDNTAYCFSLITKSNKYPLNGNASFVISMISNTIPTLADWQKIFSLPNNTEVDINAKLVIKSDNKDNFNLITVDGMDKTHNLQYSIDFQLIDANGQIKLGGIDPLIANTTRG